MRCCCCCLINWYNVVAGSRSRSFQLTWYWYVVWGWYCLKLYKKWIVIFHMLWENASHDQRPCDLIWLNNERLILLPIWTSILIHDQYWVTWYQWYRFLLCMTYILCYSFWTGWKFVVNVNTEDEHKLNFCSLFWWRGSRRLKEE